MSGAKEHRQRRLALYYGEGLAARLFRGGDVVDENRCPGLDDLSVRVRELDGRGLVWVPNSLLDRVRVVSHAGREVEHADVYDLGVEDSWILSPTTS